MKHTPGPWHIPSNGPGYMGAIFSKHGLVASVAIPRNVNDEERRPDESWLQMRQRTDAERKEIFAEQDANRALIAAAPELLEACQRLLVCMKLANWEGDDAAIYAQSAIAKATGESE